MVDVVEVVDDSSGMFPRSRAQKRVLDSLVVVSVADLPINAVDEFTEAVLDAQTLKDQHPDGERGLFVTVLVDTPHVGEPLADLLGEAFDGVLPQGRGLWIAVETHTQDHRVRQLVDDALEFLVRVVDRRRAVAGVAAGFAEASHRTVEEHFFLRGTGPTNVQTAALRYSIPQIES